MTEEAEASIHDQLLRMSERLVRNIALDITTVQNSTILTDDTIITNKIRDLFNAMAGVTPLDKV